MFNCKELTSGAYTKKPWKTPNERPRTMNINSNNRFLMKRNLYNNLSLK